MKTNSITLLLTLFFISGFSQNSRYEYGGRLSPTINKEKLAEAESLSEIMPEFSHHFSLPFNEQAQLDRLLKIVDSGRKNYVYPQQYIHILENYEEVINYVSIDISAVCRGKVQSAQNTNDRLTAEQKNMLREADPGTDIRIKIKFSYKNWADGNLDDGSKIKSGEYVVTIVPDTEAEYPGGFKQLTAYLTENIINKISDASEKLGAAAVKFTVTGEGHISDARMSNPSSDPQTDKLILDAIKRMPVWKPAMNSKGAKVKEEFSIPFGGGC
jgi:TonB family protein